jgi:hypothetical protein
MERLVQVLGLFLELLSRAHVQVIGRALVLTAAPFADEMCRLSFEYAVAVRAADEGQQA